MANEYTAACVPCTANNKGVPVTAIETGRELIDERGAMNAGIPIYPQEAIGKGPILLVRLVCPRCSKQSFMYPTIHHYTCESCGHRKEEYIRGDAPQPKPFSGQGIRLSEGMTSKAENASLLQQLRQGSIGGFGS
jgi:ribosomal protein L37E